MSHPVLFPIEGRIDCKHYVGFEGLRLHKGQIFGVMHCAHREYLNAIAGAKSKIGGTLTYWCENCSDYEPQEGI